MEKNKVVLIADDSRTARFFLCSVLEKFGYKTIEAENGVEALRSIAEKKPDYVLLDLLMPEMDGFDVLKKLKEQKINIPVIVLTADIQDEVKNECFEFGAKGFINKPFKENDLVEAFNNLLK